MREASHGWILLSSVVFSLGNNLTKRGGERGEWEGYRFTCSPDRNKRKKMTVREQVQEKEKLNLFFF